MISFRELVYDTRAILESIGETTVNEISLLTEATPLRIEAILEIMISKGIVEKIEDGKEIKTPYPVTVDTYKYTKNKTEADEEPPSLYMVLSSGPIDALYFDPEDPIPTAAEILQKYILAIFSCENEANQYADDYGFVVMKIKEQTPESPKDDDFII